MKDVKIEYTKGTGPGGQNKNKVETACRLTHEPTGIQAYADCRTRRQSYKQAMKTLKKRLKDAESEKEAIAKKEKRDKAIKDTQRIRTYDFKSGVVTDHRTGKKASIKDVLGKGKIDLLR